ncbi:NAD(+)/NADH kinase [Candidatus Micrarchaeota archaeon]|nr:NAD(+)/NADH kinase [Candidatus Micrarchaeota archaeon]
MCKNTEKSHVVAKKVLDYLERRRKCRDIDSYFMTEGTSKILGLNGRGIPDGEICRRVEAIILVGGDGAFLDSEKRFPGIPKLEINTGNVGFLSQINEKFDRPLDQFFSGKYRIEKRSKLLCKIGRRKIEALNDVHVYARKPSRPFNVRVFSESFDELFFTNAVIFSTSTGSTAHSFSVGGPLISPNLNVILMTPVAPLNPLLHPLIFPSSEKITLEVVERKASFSVDGFYDDPVDTMQITLSPDPARLIMLHKDEFWKKLRRKLFY